MCDTFVNVSPDRVILGKNSDREPNEAHLITHIPRSENIGTLACTYITIPQARRTHAVILSKPYWIWGAEMGVNEHGVAIGNEAVFTKAKREEPGLLGMDLLRLGLERGATAEEAVDVIVSLLGEHGQGGQSGHTNSLEYDNSFIVSDRREAWILETVGRDWAAKRVSGGHASISNGLTLTDADRHSPGLTGPIVWQSDLIRTRLLDSGPRQCRTSELASGRLDVAGAFAILRDHGDPARDPAHGLSGQTVCAHAGPGPIRVVQSTGSMVSHVSDDGICVWLTGTSAPCTSVFKPVWFDGLPAMPEPGRRFDPDTLWWRHEVLHREVMGNHTQRLRVFARERDALEASFLAANPDDRAGFTADCFAQAAQAERHWLQAVREVPVARLPLLYKRAWDSWNAEAVTGGR